MSDIFISHGKEDSAIALEIATGLEAVGYTTWYYERDVLPGRSHLEQTSETIEKARVVLLLVSSSSVESIEVDSEVEWAHLSRKPLVPVLVDLAWEDLEQHHRKWRRIIGSAVGINIPAGNVAAVIPRVVAGVRALGIHPMQPEGEEVRLSPAATIPVPVPAHRLRRPLSAQKLLVALVVVPIVIAVGAAAWWTVNRLLVGPRPTTMATTRPPATSVANATPTEPPTLPAVVVMATATSTVAPTSTSSPTPTRTPRPSAPPPSPTVAWISIVQRFPAPGSLAEGVAWDGKHLWLADNSGTLFQVDASGAPLDAFGVPEVTPQGLTWDGSSFWLFTTNYGLIYRFRLEGREPKTISSFKSPARVFGGGITNDLSWDGAALWYANQFNVYRLDTDGSILSSFALGKNVTGLEWDGAYLWAAYGEISAPSVIAMLDADGRELASFPAPVWGIEGLAWGDGYLWAIGREGFTGKSTVFKLNVALARAEALVRSSSSHWQVRILSARQAYFLQETRRGQTGVGIQQPIQHIAGVGRIFIVVKMGLNNPTAGAVLQLKDIAVADSRGQTYFPSGILFNMPPLPEESTIGQLEGKVIQFTLKPLELKLLYEAKNISGESTFTSQGDVSLPSLKGEWPELTLAWLVPADANELRLSIPGVPALDLMEALLATPTPTPQKK